LWRYEYDNCSLLGITRHEFLRLTMRDLEYKVNGKLFEVYAGSRMVVSSMAGGKFSDIVPLWVDEVAEEMRGDRIAELKQSEWFKKLMAKDGRAE